jgi:SAM-dependent methyltransferase
MPKRRTSEYVQYGCGFCAPESWLNFDASPTLRFERIPLLGRLYTRNAERFPRNVQYGDIVKGLPISEGACRGIYCSHVLEHLAFDDLRVALRNTYTYLQPGGVFRLVVPDLERLVKIYLTDERAEAAVRFMQSSGLGTVRRPRSLLAAVSAWLGNSAHLWMWDEKSMTHELERQGFTQIRRAAFGDAGDNRFHEVEQADRFIDALCIQCVK